uniref:hypothetical protein n=1 Tax=Roseivirga sp. TaxID=1964215 RepID=UPI00404802C8
MGSITKQTGINLGGVVLLRLFDLANATALSNGNKIPYTIAETIEDDITVSPVDSIYIMENTGTLNVSSKVDTQGITYTARMNAFIPKTNNESLSAIHNHAMKNSIALITDENSDVRLLGNDKEKITITIEETNQPGVNGYNLTIGFVSRSPIPYFTGSLS